MEPVQAATVALGWVEIAKIVLASGVVAAVIGIIKDVWIKSRERYREERFAAIQVVAKLDLYSLDSRKNISEYHEHAAGLNLYDDYMRWPRCLYPELDISQDLLKQLRVELSSAIAWLEAEKALAREHTYAIYENEPDVTMTYDHQARVVGFFGYEAYLLAGKLRDEYDLPAFGRLWGAGDDFSDLSELWKKIKAQIDKIASDRAMWNEHLHG